VTHNSFKDGIALKFSWEPPNNITTELDDSKIPLRIKDSAIQICILGHSCQKMVNTFKKLFVDELVHIANKYLIDSDHDSSILVSSESGKQIVDYKCTWQLQI